MGGGDNGCDSGLLGVTSNYIPQTEQNSPFRLMLLRLGNVTITWHTQRLLFSSNTMWLDSVKCTCMLWYTNKAGICTIIALVPAWTLSIHNRFMTVCSTWHRTSVMHLEASRFHAWHHCCSHLHEYIPWTWNLFLEGVITHLNIVLMEGTCTTSHTIHA